MADEVIVPAPVEATPAVSTEPKPVETPEPAAPAKDAPEPDAPPAAEAPEAEAPFVPFDEKAEKAELDRMYAELVAAQTPVPAAPAAEQTEWEPQVLKKLDAIERRQQAIELAQKSREMRDVAERQYEKAMDFYRNTVKDFKQIEPAVRELRGHPMAPKMTDEQIISYARFVTATRGAPPVRATPDETAKRQAAAKRASSERPSGSARVTPGEPASLDDRLGNAYDTAMSDLAKQR